MLRSIGVCFWTMDNPHLARTGKWNTKSVAGLGSALLYATVAVAMNFVNKFTLELFPLANIVLVLQMLATIVIIQPLLDLGYINFPRFNWYKARQLLMITMLYTANTAFALFGLKTLNVPMYSTLKRLTPMMVLLTKAYIKRKQPQPQITASVLLVVAGCLVAGMGDLTFDFWGYTFALLSCASQASYLLLVEFQGAEGSSTSELLYYNAIISLPLLLLICTFTGEAWQLRATYAAAMVKVTPPSFYGTIAMCSFMGCLLNFSLFLCTMNNSALTTTIVGVLKGVVAVSLGFVLPPVMGGVVKVNSLNVAGILLNMVGGVWYTIAKYTTRSVGRAIVASASADPLSGMEERATRKNSGNSLAAMLAAGGSQAPDPAAAHERQPLLAGETELGLRHGSIVGHSANGASQDLEAGNLALKPLRLH